ncbi:serine hydrolase [Ramlibacter sp.]|uniref:serine hydrolase domain-containing protein n=1 Tax=Ramlibacter sp. TaxID=1917967 RepID=UPI00260A33A1|nr:serine hydrolase [Ramlibacter sp.]
MDRQMLISQIQLVFIALLAIPLTTSATEMPYGQLVTNGFRNQAKVAYAKPPRESKALPTTTINTPIEAKQVLDDLFNRNNAKALVVARESKIIYERYSFGVGKRNTPLGYSVSKSLTALTVGKAICDGHIKSIDDPIKKYVINLSATSWGEATVKDVLRMSSGAYKTELKFDGHKSRELQLRVGTAIAEGKMSADFIDLMKENDEKSFPAGAVYNYSNFDTVALGLLVQAATGMSFSEYFEKAIWQMIGAESRGAWFVNGDGQASTYNGFSATPHDWIRIGVMVLEELGKKESCFGKFLSDATSAQISSTGTANSYGYQIWVGCRATQTDFCFAGYGGQFLIFNVATNTVIYHHATTFSPVVWQTPQVMDQLIPALAKSK